MGDGNWTPFYNHGSFVSHRFDNLTAGNYTVTLRVGDGQPNLTQNFTIESFVAPVQLGDQLSFLPWVRHKLSQTAGPADGSLRPILPLQLTLAVEGGAPSTEQVTVPLELYGPGDVVGLTPAAVLRTTPRPDTQSFSPLQLASIEFREEDLPWRYSPEAVTATNQVRPWCFLLVLEESEFSALPQGAAPLPGITVKTGVPLPDFNQLPLLAHVQVNRVLDTSSATAVEEFLSGPLQQNPALAFSRLFSPRRLRENTRYVAFLLPTYEVGRQAGRGLPITATEATASAWPALATDLSTAEPREFPVYHQWSFQTGADSDFESLARRLTPTSTALTGVNQLSITTPLGAGSGAPAAYTLDLPGVLEPLGTTTTPLPGPVAESLYQALAPGFVPGLVGSGGRPVVAPPLYGRAYLPSATLSDPAGGNALAAWPEQANLDPRYRVVAAMGSQLVQEQQQEYVQRAWDQVQDVLVANLNLRGLQFGLETSAALRRQHLPTVVASAAPNLGRAEDTALRSSSLVADTAEASTLPGGLANYGLQLTALAQPRVRLAATGLSARETIRRSNVPLGAFSPTFRRLLRPFGPYQVNLAGRPLRPTQQPSPETEQAPLGPGTSLRQRDELLSRLQSGQVRASAPKDQLIRAYQFDDTALNGLLADEQAVPTVLRVLDEQGYRQITDAQLLTEFGAAFSDLRTQTRFRTIDPVQPRLDLSALKSGMVAGTDPERVLPSRAQQALTTVSKFITGDFESADFAAEDFLVDAVLEGVTIVPPQPLPSPVPQGLTRETSGEAGPVAVSKPSGGEEAALSASLTGTVSPLQAPTFGPPIKPVQVAPVFQDALGEQLRRRHPELLLPGLADFPADTVALMQINRAFIEAYLLGANHALGSELLWRGFPVDLRASYFRQFWDVSDYLNTLPVAAATPAALAQREENLRDVAPLLSWNGRMLGANPGAGPGAQVVMVIRAELLHRFPNTVICAQPAQQIGETDIYEPDQTPARTRYPVYRLPVGQDLVALAFDLTPAEALGNNTAQSSGYFFTLLERPGEPQFGLDETSPAYATSTDPNAPPVKLRSWNDLSWDYLGVAAGDNLLILPTGKPEVDTDTYPGPVPRVRNSAELAYALFQQPVMVAIAARQLLG
ncbi:hypothetical protein D0T11_19775 [Hymenobacter rubripertinctus]|uniref:Uncharacterized protein n=1 Tax=Hymenobacter rubripertinctus TaxID=2029981 RepID=A0A418QL05_9BACT|nr:hypothetical protein D0T11_19775 [Hymenobacter rubripertinctus]